MRYLIILTLFLVGCGRSTFEKNSGDVEDTVDVIQGPRGEAGENGSPGLVSFNTEVAPGECTEIFTGVYAENIRNGEIFDVYSNDQCRDSLGEFCDNVVPSFGSSGSIGSGQPGSGTVCSVGGDLVFAERLDQGVLNITYVEFSQ